LASICSSPASRQWRRAGVRVEFFRRAASVPSINHSTSSVSGTGQYRTGYLDDGDLEGIRARGAVGDICGSYFSRDGSHVPLEMNERTIAIGFEEMRAIPNRIGVSGGPGKALANIGAVRAGLLNVLITDEDTAAEMLGILEGEEAPAKLGARWA
jgi:DNA-binding transcriptional regulator LsrR (DeoR family)